MRIPVVVIKVPLYDYTEDDQVRRFSDKDVQDILEGIKSRDDVAGWSIGSIEVIEEEWEL